MLSPSPADSLRSGPAGDVILAAAKALRQVHPEAEPVAFWDFDGTLFEGDCSEGFLSGDGCRVTGLAETAVRAGLSIRYPAAGGFGPFWQDYLQLMATQGHTAAYVAMVQAFAGAPETALKALAIREFQDRLSPWFFRDALDLWNQLEAGGVRCRVISASADFFVKGAATVLGVPEDRLHGLRLAADGGGVLTGRLVEPVTIGQGKADLLQSLLDGDGGARPVYPVAAFGNDFVTDGPMLEAVASARLPAGVPFAALVNQPLPAHYAGAIRGLSFSPRALS